MHRLFVAIRPPAAIRGALAATMDGVPGARWQDDDQLHLTLRFIGAVDRPLAEDVAAVLGGVAAPPLPLRMEGVGRFDARGRITALWAGVRPHEEVAALQRKVDRALVRVGLDSERRAYLPHVTLARLGSTADRTAAERWLGRHAGLTSDPFTATHMILYESHLGQAGARYEAVARWPLRD